MEHSSTKVVHRQGPKPSLIIENIPAGTDHGIGVGFDQHDGSAHWVAGRGTR